MTEMMRLLQRGSCGGCGIFVRNNILHDRLLLVVDHPKEGTKIFSGKIYQGSQWVNMLSVYSIANDQMVVPNWKKCMLSITGPAIIGGDFNAHHTMWGNMVCDRIYFF